MNPQDQARKLCERAAASRDPDELAEILVELRALMRQHFAHVEELTESAVIEQTGKTSWARARERPG